MKTSQTAITTPIVCGADVELGNFVTGVRNAGRTGRYAAKLLLREIEGYPGPRPTFVANCNCQTCRAARAVRRNGKVSQATLFDPQDWGRKFLPANGGCAYIDMDHLELCLPEVTNAFDHAAAWHAMLRIARKAMNNVNASIPDGQKLHLLVNNSDGLGHSYGSHQNFLVTRRTWENLFHRKMQYLLWLAAFQASSIVFTGQGKVGSENGSPPVPFQISQRADFFERLVGIQTTHLRPIVNSRDESLCGSNAAWSRLHVIFFDNTLTHAACVLKVGVMQIVLAMIEAGQVNLDLILDDPLVAVHSWSHDPSLNSRAKLAAGPSITAVELQLLFLEEALRVAANNGFDGVVPRAQEILELWQDTLLKLQEKNWPALEKRLDWVLKHSLLRRAIAGRPTLNWSSVEIKHLDHAFGSLDLDEGLYWHCERSGQTETYLSEERIAYFEKNPPEDTRAWTRAMLLRAVKPDAIADVNWHEITFDYRDTSNRRVRSKLELTNPFSLSRASAEQAFADAKGLADLLPLLGATNENHTSSRKRQRQSKTKTEIHLLKGKPGSQTKVKRNKLSK